MLVLGSSYRHTNSSSLNFGSGSPNASVGSHYSQRRGVSQQKYCVESGFGEVVPHPSYLGRQSCHVDGSNSRMLVNGPTFRPKCSRYVQAEAPSYQSQYIQVDELVQKGDTVSIISWGGSRRLHLEDMPEL
jgi:hypothetical protein